MMMNMSRIAAAVLIGGGVLLSGAASAQLVPCGDPFAAADPRDYRTASAAAIQTVERRHFTDDVRMMRRGNTSNLLAADLSYTLRRFPNHHQALMTMGEYSRKVKQNPPPGSDYPVECWFERAIRFVPDDAMVRTIYGLYLSKQNRPDQAVEQFQAALKLAGDNANVHYNLGLAYVDMKQYDKALESARTAYRLGFPLPGLKNKLQRAGVWQEPVPEASAPTEPPVASPSSAADAPPAAPN